MGLFFDKNIIAALTQVLRDGIDYMESRLALIQARFFQFTLSAFVFVLLVWIAALLGIAGFVLLNVAAGFWLKSLTGSGAWAVVILGSLYLLLSLVAGAWALRWLNRLKS